MFLSRRRVVAVLACALVHAVLHSCVVGQTLSSKQILEATGLQGGLIVHVDCGNGTLAADFAKLPGTIVHGLATNDADLASARELLANQGLYGTAAIERWSTASPLPYADNLVNLIVCEHAALLDPDEVQRVLAPGGTAYLGASLTRKPRPDTIDEWTHYLHDASGNPVAHDTQIGPPRQLQWVGGPRWARHHDHMASMTSLVTTGGRMFYIMDEGPTAAVYLPSDWHLVARDAFNGTILWKRDIAGWNTHQWPLKSGPAHLTRRLVAVDDRVYVTLSLEDPVSVLDAATGKTLSTFAGSDRTGEILVSDGTLLAVIGDDPAELLKWRRRDSYVWDNTRRANADWAWAGSDRAVKAYDAKTGRPLWEKKLPVAPCSLAADGTRVVAYDGEKIVCLNQSDGNLLWQSEPLGAAMPVHTSTGLRTVIYEDVVLFSGNNGKMAALSAADGKTLWQSKQHPSGHQSLKDLLVVDGLVWSGMIAGGDQNGIFTGRDPKTGEVKNEFLPDVDIYWFHHRCYPSKATDRFLLTSRNGIEFVDPAAQHWETHHWVRGGCIYGILPANGMVYAPMHSCGCYLEAKLNGFNALAPGPVIEPTEEQLSDAARLERGPAYGKEYYPDISALAPWWTYRGGHRRSGATVSPVSLEQHEAWQTELGGRLTAPVVYEHQVFVASIDRHTLYALGERNGEIRWSRTVGGRIDSPPTLFRGLVLFGSADGYVYALNASNGQLAWRYRAAPVDRRMVAYGQLESKWPVHGAVLIHTDEKLYCTAGRSIFLDGGIRLLKLDPDTGKRLAEVVMDERDPESGENMQRYVKSLNMPVALSDVLSSDGEFIYMRSQKIDTDGKRYDLPIEDVKNQPAEGSHLFCQIGFLDDSWFHRSFWTYGRRVTGGYGGWFQAGRMVPAGRIMAFDDDRVYGYGRKPQYYVNTSVIEYHLFGAKKEVTPEAISRVGQAGNEMNARIDKRNANSSDWRLRRGFPSEDLTAARYDWSLDQPSIQVRAMTVAANALVVAGHPDVIDERRAFRLPDDADVQARLNRQADALAGRLGGKLWLVSKTDGQPMARYELESPPVFDGLAAASGSLYMSTLDGHVARLGIKGEGALKPEAADAPLQEISDEPPEPNYLKPPEVDRSADFAKIARCKVVESKLGYRVKPAAKGEPCLALQELENRRTGKFTLKTKMRAVPTSGFLVNGYVVFGNGSAENKLVKCGIRFKSKRASIVQGPLKSEVASKGVAFDVPAGDTVRVQIDIDLDTHTVAFTADGVTVETSLAKSMTAVTHIGFLTDSSVTEFSKLKVE